MSMTKRERVLVSVVLVLAVICLYWIFFLQPHLKQMETLNSDISSKEVLASSSEQQQLIITSLEESIAENEEKLAALSNGGVVGFDQPDAIVYLEKTINQYAYKTYFEFDNVQPGGQLSVYHVTIKMASKYDGLKKVLAAFQEGPYFLKVVSLKTSLYEFETAETETPEGGTEGGTETETPEGGTEGGTETEQPQRQFDNSYLIVEMGVEFYSPVTSTTQTVDHPFAEGYQFGGDIFQ